MVAQPDCSKYGNCLTCNKEFDINLLEEPQRDKYDAIILAVAHDEFKKLSVEEIKAYGLNNHVLYDIKYLLDKSEVDGRL